jgi:hypothetical protein
LPAKIVHTETAATDVDAAADPAAVPDSIDELCRRTSTGGHHIIENFIAVDEVFAVNNRIGNFYHDNRIVAIFRLIDGRRGVQISAIYKK